MSAADARVIERLFMTERAFIRPPSFWLLYAVGHILEIVALLEEYERRVRIIRIFILFAASGRRDIDFRRSGLDDRAESRERQCRILGTHSPLHDDEFRRFTGFSAIAQISISCFDAKSARRKMRAYL